MLKRMRKAKVGVVRSWSWSLFTSGDGNLVVMLVVVVFTMLLVSEIVSAQERIGVKVGVVMDNNNNNKWLIMRYINMALSDFYETHSHFHTRLELHVTNSSSPHDDLLSASSALDLVKNVQVAAIIGPETSEETQFMIKIGDKAHVPIISYSATSSFLSPAQNPYFVRATQKDSSQVHPLRALVQHFGWKEAVLVYPDDPFFAGGEFVSSLLDSLQQIGVHVPYRSVFSLSSSDEDIEAELYKLGSMQTRVFLVHMLPSLGARFFEKVNHLRMMTQDYVWIVTTSMSDALSSLNPDVIRSMQGVLGIKTYVPWTRVLQNFTDRWKTKSQQGDEMTVYGLWAYDATIALAKAIEQVGFDTNYTYLEGRDFANLSMNPFAFGVSPVGPRLLESIRSVRFKGLSGNFTLSHGELELSSFKIINVVGSGEKEIGYWTSFEGLVKELNAAKSDLQTIIWPGDGTLVPKGWVASPNGKKLRIAVPIKDGFVEFIKVTQNSTNNTTKVTGYCIDVFEAVIKELPYSVLHEYIPYTEVRGEPTASYNGMIQQVYQKNYDAVVGDMTIRWSRALFADFTQPYTESGVIMVAPWRDESKNREWLFVKPLTLGLWVVTLCFFIFIAVAIWVLEHRINQNFRGPPMHQVGTSLYYAFSTMVFSHSTNVFNNLTRLVVIIWVFVLLILTQCYTANLASLLTVEQLEPAIKEVSELLRRHENVGYQEGSFVKELLKQMNFKDSQLKSYSSIDQLNDLLSKGTNSGGIAVAFDEIPYIKLFLDKYCSKYTMVPPTYKSDGFGFAFTLGSPLVSDVSRAVLKVTEGDEMTSIEKKWFKQQNNCPDSTSSLSARSLDLDSFKGLFYIAGVPTFLAIVIYAAGFCHQNIHILQDSNISLQTKVRKLWGIFIDKDLNSHTFNQPAPTPVDTATNTPFPQSPSSYMHDPETELNDFDNRSIETPERMNPDMERPENA